MIWGTAGAFPCSYWTLFGLFRCNESEDLLLHSGSPLDRRHCIAYSATSIQDGVFELPGSHERWVLSIQICGWISKRISTEDLQKDCNRGSPKDLLIDIQRISAEVVFSLKQLSTVQLKFWLDNISNSWKDIENFRLGGNGRKWLVMTIHANAGQ